MTISTYDSVTSKKLQIQTKMGGQTIVVDDGTASGGDINITNGFDLGYQPNPGVGDYAPDRVGFDVQSLTCSRQGKSLTIRVYDYVHSNVLKLGYGDTVEFWCDQGGSLTPASGSFPSWHSHEQGAGQVQHFYGFVDSFDIFQTPDEQGFTLECVDPLTFADNVIVRRLYSDGSTAENTVIVGDNERDNQHDWFYGIKKLDTSAPWTFGWGNPTNTELTMTVEDFLDYLEGTFGQELEDLGVKAVGGDLFNATDKALLTNDIIKMSFTNQGFGSCVRQVLQQNYPDLDVRVDPRTKEWHFVTGTKDIISSGSTDITNVVSTSVVDVTDTEAFATSGNGSSARIISATNIYQTEIVDIKTVVSSTQLEFTAPTSFTAQVGDIVIPMYGASDRPPSLTIDKDEWGSQGGFRLKPEFDDVYTAVRILGENDQTERITLKTSNPDAAAGVQVKVETTHDTSFEAGYRQNTHQRRSTDRGEAGLGIEIDEIDTETGKTVIWFSELKSYYADDHDTSDNGEWEGTVCHILTKGGGDDFEVDNITSIITLFEEDGTMAANVKRYKITLADDLLTAHPTIQDQVNDADPDFFQMTASEAFHKPQNPNRRSWVATGFRIVNTTAADDGNLLTDVNCPATVNTLAGGFASQVVARPPGQANDAPYTQAELNAYWNLSPTDPGAGHARAWFLKRPKQHEPTTPGAQSCVQSALVDILPQATTVSFDRITESVLNVRVPDTGFEGIAWRYFNHERELEVRLPSYKHSSQNTQVAVIADNLWRRLSEPDYVGELSVGLITRWLPLADLGARIFFGTGNTGGPLGQVTYQGRFYGLLQAVTYDFASGETRIAFDSRGFEDDVAEAFIDRTYISTTSEMEALQAEADRLANEARCLANNPHPTPPEFTPACDVAGYGGQNLGKVTATVAYKDDQLGGASVSVGAPPLGNLSSPDNRGGHPFRGDWVHEIDFDGNVISILQPQGVPYGNTTTGVRAIPDKAVVAEPRTLPRRNAEVIQNLEKAFWGADGQLPVWNMRVLTAAGSTTTVIQLDNAIPNDGRFNGGYLSFGVNDAEYEAPKLAITSHTASTITLTSAMSRTAPPAGYEATVWASRIPPLDSTDFPNGGTPFIDPNANWFVVEPDGDILSAVLVSGTLELKGSPDTPELQPGNRDADVRPQGNEWDFDETTLLVPFADTNSHIQTATRNIEEILTEVGYVVSGHTRFWPTQNTHVSQWDDGTTLSVDSSRVKQCADGSTNAIGWQKLEVPVWHNGTDGNLVIEVEWFADANGGESDTDWIFAVRYRTYTPTDTNGVTAPALTKVQQAITVPSAYTALDRVRTQLTYSGGDAIALTPGDEFEFKAQRDGGDGADDYTDTVNVTNVRVGASTVYSA